MYDEFDADTLFAEADEYEAKEAVQLEFAVLVERSNEDAVMVGPRTDFSEAGF